MKLYHGSKMIVDSPLVKGSKDGNDYGPAFYLTRDLVSAHEWACRNNTVGIVNEYSFNIKGLMILDLRDKTKWSVLNWLAVLMHFRKPENTFIRNFKNRIEYIENNYYVDIDHYDVVIGCRADDAFYRFPLDFIRGNITLEQLEYSFYLGNLGIQYALISQKAFNHLKYIKSFQSEHKFINSYFNKITNASKSFDLLDKDEEGTRITDLLRNKK